MYRVRKEDGYGFARGGETTGRRRGGTKGKTQISLPLPSLLSMEFYALRVFDAARTRGSAAFSLHPPLWLTLTRYFDDTRSANTERRIRVNAHAFENGTGGGKKKKKRKREKITTEQTIRVTWTTATSNVGVVNELSRQKLQLLRVQVWEPRKWIRPMTRDGRENNC